MKTELRPLAEIEHNENSPHVDVEGVAADGNSPRIRLEWIEAGSLAANPANWRRHPDGQLAALRGVITDPAIGWAGALLFNEQTGWLIDGHARQKLVDPSTPVPVLIGSWSPEAETKILISLDPVAGMALADLAQLEALLKTVQLDDSCFDGLRVELDDIVREAKRLVAEQDCATDIVEDQPPEPPAIPVTQAGDLWQLGDHRLLCGDCTNPEDVRRLMGDERAILFATDPPYLIGYDGTNHPHKWSEQDKNKDWSGSYAVTWDDADANLDLYDRFIAVAVQHTIRPNAAWYCWHASRRQALLEASWTRHGAFVHQQIVWCKDRPILTRSWYMWQHEPCFMGWVRPHRPPRTAVDFPASVWMVPTVPPGTKTEHPTSKPVELFAMPMRQHTKPGDICYEPFSGSGTQIIAAEQLSRRCFALEISPAYVDVAVARWEKLTGKKAERMSKSGAEDSARRDAPVAAEAFGAGV